MTNSINLLTDEDLLCLFQMNADEILVCRRRPSISNGLKAVQLRIDRKEIMDEIEYRLSPRYITELEDIKRVLAEKAMGGIKPGDRYRHKVIKALTIQVVDEAEFSGPVWSVRAMVTKIYACRLLVKTSTILEHFVKLTEPES
jgi:hypothetical protein